MVIILGSGYVWIYIFVMSVCIEFDGSKKCKGVFVLGEGGIRPPPHRSYFFLNNTLINNVFKKLSVW